uniref:Uncharacterized protein n=1 Tax=Vitis vinifera TaxID=29760 RepID=A5BF21_VITVI|nr:hypothetical protein VITISV_028867 [Vitis vinifera]
MRSRVCFDAVHSDRLRLLIEYGMLTGLHYFGGYRGCLISGFFESFVGSPWTSYWGIPLCYHVQWFLGIVLKFDRPNSTIFRYLPGPFFGTRPNFTRFRYLPGTFSGTRPEPSPVLARSFFGTCSNPSPVLARNLLRYSPGPFSGTRPDPSPVLARTLLRYSPGAFSFSGIRPNPSPVVARILPVFGTCPKPSPVLARTLFRYSPEFYPFSVLARIPPFFGTRSDSTVFRYLPEPFSGTCPDQIPNLSRHRDRNFFPSGRPVGIRFGRFSRFIESAEPTTNPYGFLVVKQAEKTEGSELAL